MIKKDRAYVTIALNEESVKAAYIQVTGDKTKLLGVAKRDVRNLPDLDLTKTVQSLINSLNPKNAENILVIPAALATTKNIEIPSRDPNEIKSIINLQAGRHSPYSREEILISYATIGIHDNSYTKVLLVISNRNVVNKQLNLLERAGVEVSRVLFAPEAMSQFYAKRLDLLNEEVPVGIIDLGGQTTDFLIELRGKVIACRSIAVGMKQLSTTPETRDKFVAELAQSLEAYQAEAIDKLPATFILSSDDVNLKELQPVLKEKLKANIKPVPYLDHIESSQVALLKVIQEYNDDSFLDIISAAGIADDAQVDLMPEEMKLQKSLKEHSQDIIQAFLYGLLFVAGVCAVFGIQLYFKGLLKTRLDQEFIRRHNQVTSLQAIDTKNWIVKDYLKSRMIGLDVFKELYRIVPAEIYLESVDMDDKGTIIIRGVSDSSSYVFSLVTDLQSSKLFKNVETHATTPKKDRGKDVYSFEIAFQLKNAKTEEKKKTDDKSEPTKEAATATTKS